MSAVYVFLEIFCTNRHSPTCHLTSVGIDGGGTFARDGYVVLAVGMNHGRTSVEFCAFPSREDRRQVGIGIGTEQQCGTVEKVQADVAFQFESPIHIVLARRDDDRASTISRTLVYERLERLARIVGRRESVLSVKDLDCTYASCNHLFSPSCRHIAHAQFFLVQSRSNLSDSSVGIVEERVATYGTAHTIVETVVETLAEVGCVVEEVVLTLVVYKGMMVRATIHRVEYDASVFVRAERRGAGAVGYHRLAARERTCRIRHIVETIALVYPDGFEETLRTFYYMHFAIVGDEVVVEADATHRVLSHEEISLPVIIDEDTWVDEVAVAHHARRVDRDEWMPEWVVEGAVGAVAHSHTYVLLVGRVVEVVFAVVVDAVGSPSLCLRPLRVADRVEYDSVVSPVNHVRGAESVVVFHRKTECVVLVVTWIHP